VGKGCWVVLSDEAGIETLGQLGNDEGKKGKGSCDCCLGWIYSLLGQLLKNKRCLNMGISRMGNPSI